MENSEGKIHNIGMGCCVPVLAPIENYYTKWQVDRLIENIDVSGITEEEVEEMISSATSGLASEQWVEDQHYLTEHQSLSGYATESYVQNYTYDKQTIDDKVAQGGTFDPTQYYNKTATDALLNEKLDATAYTPTDLSNYYNKTQVDEKIASAKTQVEAEIPSLNGYATEQWVENKNYITGVDLSNYDTKSEVNTKVSTACGLVNDALTGHTSNNDIHVTTAQTASWDAKSNFSGSYNDLTNKPTIPSIWSGTEAQWAQISGGTLDNNTIYLVY